MTIERRILVGLPDILSVSLRCKKCSYKISMSPDKVVPIPNRCPDGHDWFLGAQNASVVAPFVAFMDALTRLRKQETGGFDVILEIEEPKAVV
jgi:hypothetical protein